MQQISGLEVVVNPHIPVGQDGYKQEKNLHFGTVYNEVRSAQGLLAATHISYCLHLPLVLKPDHILITILQSLALAILQNPTEFSQESKIEKREITCRTTSIEKSDWNRIFETFRKQIAKSVHLELAEEAKCNFSTSCSATQNVANIALMQAASPFVKFKLEYLCGIPIVHLLGTKEDWELLYNKVDKISSIYQSLNWWFNALKPVVKEFASLWDIQPNLTFWKSFYGFGKVCNERDVSGPINAFFPYVYQSQADSTLIENPWFQDNKKWNSFNKFPKMDSGLEFYFKNEEDGSVELWNAYGRLAGAVTVNENSIMPFSSWKVTNQGNVVIAEGHEVIPGSTVFKDPVLENLMVCTNLRLCRHKIILNVGNVIDIDQGKNWIPTGEMKNCPLCKGGIDNMSINDPIGIVQSSSHLKLMLRERKASHYKVHSRSSGTEFEEVSVSPFARVEKRKKEEKEKNEKSRLKVPENRVNSDPDDCCQLF